MESDEHNAISTSHSTSAIPTETRYSETMNQWTTGFWRRLPWKGMAALLTSIVTAAVMVVILVLSDDRPIIKWSIQPDVFLAITSAVANSAVHFALSQGVTVAWWVKAMKPDSTVTELHNTWSFGSSVWDALLAGRSFNLIALAGLAVAAMPIHGPLLQRASVTTTQISLQNKTLTIPAAMVMPGGFTGIITGRSHSVGLPTLNFSAIVNDYNIRRPITVAGSGCLGTCAGLLLGAGYSIDCKNSTVPYDISPNPTDASFKGAGVFSTNFTYDEYEGGLMNFTALWKPQQGCVGSLRQTKCMLKPATIEYPVMMTNDTISLDPPGSFKTDRVIELRPVYPNGAQGPTTHGGMYLVLDSMFKSGTNLRFAGAVGYETTSSGSTTYQYARTDASLFDCNQTWADPTFDILSAARELSFRTALVAAAIKAPYKDDSPAVRPNTFKDPSEYLQRIQVQQSVRRTVFKSDYRFLAVALVFVLLATFSTVPIFFGWWSLGRNVSLSPIEIGKAFAAPGLADAPDANAEVTALLREVGDTRLQYGAVVAGERDVAAAEGKVSTAHAPPVTLRFDAPYRCSKLQEGQAYIG